MDVKRKNDSNGVCSAYGADFVMSLSCVLLLMLLTSYVSCGCMQVVEVLPTCFYTRTSYRLLATTNLTDMLPLL